MWIFCTPQDTYIERRKCPIHQTILMKTVSIRFTSDEERFIKKVTSYGKFKHLSDIKSLYMEVIMRALASVT